jgi:hypothetical protein
MTDRIPAVTGDLSGWERADAYAETVFRLPTASVEGHTVLYEDRRLSEALDDVGFDGPWRFLFATRLTFVPPLAPGIGPASMYPTVATEAADAFVERLADRGFEDVRRARSERVRVDTGERARLRKYTARFDPGGDRPELDVEGWTALWVRNGEFLLAGGAYPTRGLAELLDGVPEERRPDVSPSSFRNELLALIRSVE